AAARGRRTGGAGARARAPRRAAHRRRGRKAGRGIPDRRRPGRSRPPHAARAAAAAAGRCDPLRPAGERGGARARAARRGAHLRDIVARLEAAGAAAGHPAAIIERATLPGQRILRGTLSNIVALARAHRIEPPSILILGDVAAFAATEAGATPLPRASAPGVPA